MPPAVSRPWLVTLKSTMKSMIPTRIRITPIVGGITIIGTVPSGRQTDIRLKVASSLEGDCTAHRGGDFIPRKSGRGRHHAVYEPCCCRRTDSPIAADRRCWVRALFLDRWNGF